MKNKPKEKEYYIHVTIPDMFNMLEGFSDGLLEHMKIVHPVDTDKMIELTAGILSILRESGVEGRLAIIILLETACAMYHMGVNTSVVESSSCPTDLLN